MIMVMRIIIMTLVALFSQAWAVAPERTQVTLEMLGKPFLWETFHVRTKLVDQVDPIFFWNKKKGTTQTNRRIDYRLIQSLADIIHFLFLSYGGY